MKYYGLLSLVLVLFGCQTPPDTFTSEAVTPEFNAEIRKVSIDELDRYWIMPSQKPKMLKKRPDWLPEGKGQWRVKTVIDSNGHVVERTLLSATPAGFMTQRQLDAMPKPTYEPAVSNPKRIPVEYIGTAKIAPRSEL